MQAKITLSQIAEAVSIPKDNKFRIFFGMSNTGLLCYFVIAATAFYISHTLAILL